MKLALAQMQMTPSLDENYQKSLDYFLLFAEVDMDSVERTRKMKPYTTLRRPAMYE